MIDQKKNLMISQKKYEISNLMFDSIHSSNMNPEEKYTDFEFDQFKLKDSKNDVKNIETDKINYITQELKNLCRIHLVPNIRL